MGNVVLWYAATFSLFVYFGLAVIYMLRRRRLCYDVPEGRSSLLR